MPGSPLEVRAYVVPGASVYTDALKSYEGLADVYQHAVIDHAESYVRGSAHTNGLENFWSLLKAGDPRHHVNVEPFHLFHYLDGQMFRFNARKATDAKRFLAVLRIIVGRRFTYKSLIGQDYALATTPT